MDRERQPLLAGANGAPASTDRRQQTIKSITLILAMFLLVFTTASNMSLITTTQSEIAIELDRNQDIPLSWMVSSYIVASTSTLPLAGKLCAIFSTQRCIIVAGVIFSIGVIISGSAETMITFLLGRSLSGAASGAFVSASLIFILQVAPTKYRGFFLGLQSLGFTVSVSSDSSGRIKWSTDTVWIVVWSKRRGNSRWYFRGAR